LAPLFKDCKLRKTKRIKEGSGPAFDKNVRTGKKNTDPVPEGVAKRPGGQGRACGQKEKPLRGGTVQEATARERPPPRRKRTETKHIITRGPSGGGLSGGSSNETPTLDFLKGSPPHEPKKKTFWGGRKRDDQKTKKGLKDTRRGKCRPADPCQGGISNPRTKKKKTIKKKQNQTPIFACERGGTTLT